MRADDPFFAFLQAIVDRPGLVVLGDLFDAWVGPAHARLSGAARIVAALHAAHARGLAIQLVPGNRDFLLDAMQKTCGRKAVRRAGPRGAQSDCPAWAG